MNDWHEEARQWFRVGERFSSSVKDQRETVERANELLHLCRTLGVGNNVAREK